MRACRARRTSSMPSNTMTVLEPDHPTTTTSQSASFKYSQHHCEEMLTTPKFMPDSAGLMSPRHMMAHASSSTAACDDMLTTPVLTTPKTSDMWPPSSAASLSMLASSSRFSPDQASTSSCSSPPPMPSRDLPMDSDIGLRSPCDGLLAKRRQKFRQKPSESSESVGAAPACDNTASSSASPRNSSPHDLTVKNGVSKDASRVQVKLEFHEEAPASSAEGQPSRSEPTTSAPVISDFKHPNTAVSKLTASELPSHYTPSPGLAVPSPNWMVVERYLRPDMLTPKVLDGTVFDFLGTVPLTPRSKLGGGRDHSPHETDRYSGRDQKLSPRLSPRFPIPEVPTDLSSKAGSADPAASYSSEAEDLSVSAKSGSKRVKDEPPVAHYSNQSHHHPPQQQHNHHVQHQHQFHQEQEQQVPRLPHQHVRHNVAEATPSRSVSPPPPPATGIKTEANELQAPPQTFPPASFAPFYNFYSRQMYPADLQRSLVTNHYQQMASASGFGGRGHLAHQQSVDMMYDVHQGHGYGGLPQPHGHLPHQQHQMWPSPLGLPLLHPGQDGHQRPNSQMSWSPDRRSREDEDGDDDAEAGAVAAYPMPAIALKNNLLMSPSETPKKKRASKNKAGPDAEDEGGMGKKRNKGKGKGPKEPNGSKRTYVCPHCQRSYDWNYNLNRHLKYECGKENAFQCAKCGRKFPHKQNCVYHLKRKHKVVCDSIDQYMSAGLVIFRGMAGAQGPDGEMPLAPQVMIKEEFGAGSSLGSDN